LSNELSDINDIEIFEFYKTIGENVKKARMDAKMSQLELALKLGIQSVAFYSNCESVRYNKHFNLEHIYKISKVLDVRINSLIPDQL
jgi:transcriptional regulator with XRE-family HTH domain